ncbi:serine hydrolase domain-containing protein [Aliiglaciecola sp. CAU 1673]|uniref:serine hydrolase domain-containing protein n=1 Tax=Aliiglaciecola sp. CAU 1673 TaxID=3032595 RepID=UPI0023DC682F|nr:serine hydrolase domain-containing protein [Aliiglaciecola sp. CAU 1673]
MLTLGCGSGTANQSTAPESPVVDPTQSLSSILNSAIADGVDGILVYVDKAGHEPIIATAGHHERGSQQSIAADALFKVASISKLFIAVAVTKLAHENSLSLDDSLALWLPEYTNAIQFSESITIRQMLQHRSGIPDFDSQPGFSWENAHTDLDATLAFALHKPADFSPNSRYEYSNTNYLLLGKLMDRVLGFSHQDYIQQRILAPLQMHNTYLVHESELADRLVSGYWLGINRENQDYRIPGGSMISTVEDIGIFIRALNNGTLLNNTEKSLYPYWFEHSGWLPGYQSNAAYQAANNTVVVQFVSTTGGSSETVASRTYQSLVSYAAGL